jgi:amino acid transporter
MSHPTAHFGLTRRLGLSTAVALNMMEMIGVGPFVTLPIILATAGARFSAWAWLLGAFIALCDGLVWAELGATFPDAGGSYAFLRQLYHPRRAGRWVSFLYVWQLSFSAPLSIASGCLGVAAFTAWLWPVLGFSIPFGPITLHGTSLIAATACLLVTALLYRNLRAITRIAWILFFGVLVTIVGVVASGAVVSARLHPTPTLASLLGWPTLALVPALAQATLIACYDYWGYYNICFLGSEVRNPQRTIPRAILISLAIVAALYLAMNFALLPALHSTALASADPTSRIALVADLARAAFGSTAARILAALILWSAFASVFSLLLGYSRVPWAAARDGNFFRALDRLHPRHGFPHRSLVALGLTATLFCFFSLSQVIALLVVIRILLQFLLQHFGLLALRRRRPELPRPFRMPLYPLPVFAAIAGFVFILVFRPHPLVELAAALAIAASGSAIYLLSARRHHNWPFSRRPMSGRTH